jgi:hypothetical protein
MPASRRAHLCVTCETSLEKQHQCAGEEAGRAERSSPVGGGQAENRPARRHYKGRHRRDPEEHAAGHVDCGHRPLPVAAPAGDATGERARDEEGSRPKDVRSPDQAIPLLRGEPVLHCGEGAQVEQQGPHELDRRAPPRRIGTEPTPPPHRAFPQLEAGRQGEEDRAAKKTRPSAPGPTSCTNPGNGPIKKHADPTAKPPAIQRSQAALSSGRCATASE